MAVHGCGGVGLSAIMIANSLGANVVAIDISDEKLEFARSIGAVANLRKHGKHIQVGLMVADHCHPPVPMDKVIANELEILGSYGMQAHRYTELLTMIQAGKLFPEKLIGKTISLEESITELPNMNNFSGTGVTVIDRF